MRKTKRFDTNTWSSYIQLNLPIPAYFDYLRQLKLYRQGINQLRIMNYELGNFSPLLRGVSSRFAGEFRGVLNIVIAENLGNLNPEK